MPSIKIAAAMSYQKPLSWNEIRARAVQFSRDWKGESREEAEAKSFLDAFFNVFGVSRQRMATFEHRVKKLDGNDGFIDLFWKGMFLVEMKSAGRDLEKALAQAKNYCQTLPQHELPKAILVCDFQRFELIWLDSGKKDTFSLENLHENIRLFGWLIGYQKVEIKPEDPANIEAALLMGNLHDAMRDIGYAGHDLETYLVRLLFCIFAEDTGIFERKQFQDFIETRTGPDGSDLAGRLAELFQVLNTPIDRRMKILDESLAAFPYVNGQLFGEPLPVAAFDSAMRESLLGACRLDWSVISPAIFGSLFQAILNADKKERRNLGAHYTSEPNILKVIRPLFLDKLWAEFEKVKSAKRLPKLQEFHQKLADLRFLDPACGCGNFLIIAYRELRILEIEVIRALLEFTKFSAADGDAAILNVSVLVKIDVDQFAGIEIDERAARIAEVAMWLTDHQMNRRVSDEFGQYFARLPLRKAARIVHANALRVDWSAAFLASELDFIFGNPPFVGSKLQSEEQRADMIRTFGGGVQDAAIMDFVSAWYIKAARFIQNTSIRCAFVSTNSICQGEQVGVLWSEMLNRWGIKIHFAHRTFKWSNEAKGNAAVFCVIVGFGKNDIDGKVIFDYEDVKGEPKEIAAKNINPYLVDAKDLVISKRLKSIAGHPSIVRGSIAYDDGSFFIDENYFNEIKSREPEVLPFVKFYVGSVEFINNKWRRCFWLKNIDPSILRKSKILNDVISRVYAFRTKEGGGLSVKSKAKTSYLFGDIRQPDSDYILIPRVSSERRTYIPMGFVKSDVILGDSAYGIPNATLFLFGMLNSMMHMAWVKYVCGRLKSDFRYSGNIVYNNYPFPNPTEKQKSAVERAAETVLAARSAHPTSSLADLYDPLTMPADLVRAHQNLDRAVDLCYRAAAFSTEMQRIEHLFELYEALTNPLGLAAAPEVLKKGRGKKG